MSQSVVIITGNPKRITKKKHKSFYDELAVFLQGLDCTVQFDAGNPYTTPLPADIWIGHSRGADRLRFAPEKTLTIALGSHKSGAINHSKEIVSPDPTHFDSLSKKEQQYHFTLDTQMKNEIANRIKKNRI